MVCWRASILLLPTLFAAHAGSRASDSPQTREWCPEVGAAPPAAGGSPRGRWLHLRGGADGESFFSHDSDSDRSKSACEDFEAANLGRALWWVPQQCHGSSYPTGTSESPPLQVRCRARRCGGDRCARRTRCTGRRNCQQASEWRRAASLGCQERSPSRLRARRARHE